MSFFKSIIVYRLGAGWTPPAADVLETEMQRLAFQPCGPAQQASAGWVPPRGEENGAMCENVGGQLILKLAVERKAVPGSAVKAELDARCKAIEAERGRKPGKKEKQEIKEEIILDMLPRAFSKKSAHIAWIDVTNRFLVVGAGSYKAADAVITHIVDMMAALGAVIPLTPIQTQMSPAGAMSAWLGTQEAPEKFSVDRDLILKGEDKATVKYNNHALDIEEVVQHIQAGMVPTQLALTWNGKVSILLTDALVVKKITYIDVDTNVGKDDGFDADVAIATGELAQMLPDLLAALGGELDAKSE